MKNIFIASLILVTSVAGGMCFADDVADNSTVDNNTVDNNTSNGNPSSYPLPNTLPNKAPGTVDNANMNSNSAY